VPDGSDNCPAWPNPAQNSPVWAVPAGDIDCDGFTATRESFIGTDASDQCADTTIANDEEGPAQGEPI
jgi:hypothetical protein